MLKTQKTRSYHSRYQVKFKRRREGKTDYRQRKRLIAQDKNKYNTPKYRFVVRVTNTKVVTQVIYATISGDRVVATATSHELPRFGIKLGLTNYAASYATGLLLARRLLKKLKLDTVYQGSADVTGEEFHQEDLDKQPGAFKCFLDIGLARTSTGARIFAAMKGAVDGGLNIPHSINRFPGYDSSSKKYDAAAHRARIMGQHVSAYMKSMEEADEDTYKRHFSRYLKEGLNADGLESMYKQAHAAIRANPDAEKTEKKAAPAKTAAAGGKRDAAAKKRFGKRKLANAERENKVKQKKTAHVKAMQDKE